MNNTLDIETSMDTLQTNFAELLARREVVIPESGILAGPIYPVRAMIEAGQRRACRRPSRPIAR